MIHRAVHEARADVWVLDGLRLLNHPLRSEPSAVLLPKALDRLLEVHRTGALMRAARIGGR